MSLEEARDRVKERAESLPDVVWDCEACDTDDSMKIRRSSLNGGFFADDLSFKCMNCWYFRVHGIPFSSQEEYEEEMELRQDRVLDFAIHGDSDDVMENMRNLGYLDSSE